MLQDHKRDNGFDVFRIKGDQHKPDLVCMNGQNTAIEIKIGDEGNSLGFNSGILTYFNNYCEGITTYFDEQDRPIKIDNFVLATQYSKHGRFKQYESVHKNSESRKNVEGIYVPLIEYETTFNILRMGIWQPVNRKRYCNCGVGIGALLSTILGYNPSQFNWRNKNISTDHTIPAILIKTPNPKILTKNGDHRWGSEWKPL